jgi:hypothetical protein
VQIQALIYRNWYALRVIREVQVMQIQTLKQELANMIQNLPDDCTIEDVQYRLHLINKVRRGEERLKAEGGISQKAAEERLSKWITR